MRRKKPWSDLDKILHWGDIRNLITDANFGDDRLRRFSVAISQILGFSISFRRRPYNTLALPCECVILLTDRQTNKQTNKQTGVKHFFFDEWNNKPGRRPCRRYGTLRTSCLRRLSGRFPATTSCRENCKCDAEWLAPWHDSPPLPLHHLAKTKPTVVIALQFIIVYENLITITHKTSPILSRVSKLTRNIDIAILSVRLSLRLSVTRWYFIKTAEYMQASWFY